MSDSIGLVEPKKVTLDKGLRLESGKELKKIELIYESYGNLTRTIRTPYLYAMP